MISFVVATERLLAKVLEIQELSFLKQQDDLFIFGSNEPVSGPGKQVLLNLGFVKIFEDCYVPDQCADYSRERIVRVLFESIGAESYLKRITIQKNVGCYQVLLRRAVNQTPNLSRVLDVGCGPGTILDAVDGNSFHITGFDFVEDNLVAARKKGLNTVGSKELMLLPANSVDLVICSFVLHYESLSLAMISQIASLIRPYGLWAANFHKDRGYSWFTEMLIKTGTYHLRTEESEFGRLLFATKLES
ncbi:class I SAM-dependent methyltransferase [Herbaspirillum frisingense]|uniref:class I SAM-dependent methyltransferase n=1 Tax=Herbaspirillum frisingense TaxID=92645 RepID=UPI0009DA42F0|nr:class I SAM-dependent methyltransferase [Herbaspirillum frisingense]